MLVAQRAATAVDGPAPIRTPSTTWPALHAAVRRRADQPPHRGDRTAEPFGPARRPVAAHPIRRRGPGQRVGGPPATWWSRPAPAPATAGWRPVIPCRWPSAAPVG